MNEPTQPDHGIVELDCSRPVAETAARLEEILKAHGIKVFARIDHAAEARAAGLEMLPTLLLIFGDPKIGTSLMVRHPSLALDLPTKALIRETAGGGVRLSYNSAEFLQRRHGLDEPPLGKILGLLAQAAGNG